MCNETDKIKKIVQKTIEDFCKEFVKEPYICYTEHGQHAYFYSMLFKRLSENGLYFDFKWNERKLKICVLQKEYPTAGKLGKSKRQHWDIALIQLPPSSLGRKKPEYDYFALNTVVEFGMNERRNHLKGDIARLNHPKSRVKNKFAVHLLRISRGFSGRDISPKSERLIEPQDVRKLVRNKDVIVYLAISDLTESSKSAAWLIDDKHEPKRLP